LLCDVSLTLTQAIAPATLARRPYMMRLAEMTWPAVAALPKSTPILIPVAALEQHGHHMPLFTDSLLLGEVVRRLEESHGMRALFAPLTWLGNSEHHLDFAGTLSASPRVYLDLLGDVASNFLHHGFTRILFLNGHGGNDVPGRQAVFELRQRFRQRQDLLLLFATYWLIPSKPREWPANFAQQQMGHACEWETSMMLRIQPHLVASNFRDVAPVPFGNPFEPAARGWVTQDRSKPGHIGQPGLASAEKGEVLLATFAADAAALLDRVLAWDGVSWDG